MSQMKQIQNSLLSEQYNERQFKELKDTFRLLIMISFLFSPIQTIQVKLIVFLLIITFIFTKLYKYINQKEKVYFVAFDITQLFSAFIFVIIQLFSSDNLQNQYIINTRDQNILSDQLFFISFINQVYQIITQTILSNYRITTILSSILLCLQIYQRIEIHHQYYPDSFYSGQKILIANIIGIIQNILGILIFNIIDIELQKQSEENSKKDIKIMKVVHDMKNPILSIKNMLLDNELIINNKESLLSELSDMEGMLDDLRTEFKFNNQMAFKESVTSINTIDLINSLKYTHQSLAKTNHNIVEQTAHVKFPKDILIQNTIVKRILNNFISNSIKHTKKNRVCINLRIESQDAVLKNKNNDQSVDRIPLITYNNSILNYNEQSPSNDTNSEMNQLVFEVSDYGTGITEDKLRQIFEEKESDQSGDNWEGTCLGLPICAYLALNINAIIRYNSITLSDDVSPVKQRRKTYFILQLPLKQDQYNQFSEIQSIKQDYLSSVDTVDQSKNKCNTFIIVEDNESIIKMYRKILNSSGKEYLIFKSAEECVEYLEYKHRNECTCNNLTIMTDLVLPGMSGNNLAYTIRQMKFHVPVYIILATAEVGMQYEIELFDEVWEKPVGILKFNDIQSKQQSEII